MSQPHQKESFPRTHESSGLGKLLVFLLIALAGIAISIFTPLRQYLTIESVREFSRELGARGPAALLIFGAFGPLFFLPRWPVCFAGGMLYGIVWGSVIGNVAGLAGVMLHYAASRFFVSTGSERLLKKFHMDPSRLRKENAFWIIFLLRAIPVSNSAMTNVLAGALKMSVGSYIVSSFLGMIPSTVMYAAWGKLMKKPDADLFILALGILLTMMLGTLAARRYVFRKSEPEAGTL